MDGKKEGKGSSSTREYSWNSISIWRHAEWIWSKSEEYASGMTGVQLLAETLPENDIRGRGISETLNKHESI